MKINAVVSAVDPTASGFITVCLFISALLLARCGGVAEAPAARDACEHPSLDSPTCAFVRDFGVWQCGEDDGTFWELEKSGEWIHSESKVNDAGELDKLCDLAPDGGLIWRAK